MIQTDFLFIDFETTGLLADTHCVTEVAAIAMSSDLRRELARYHALVMPSNLKDVDPVAMKINNFEAELWIAKAKQPKEVFGRLLLMSAGRRLAAHFADFDVSFLQAGLVAHGHDAHPMRPQMMCTRMLLMPAFAAGLVPSLSLAPACAHLGIELEHHNPLSDCLASIEIARYAFGLVKRI